MSGVSSANREVTTFVGAIFWDALLAGVLFADTLPATAIFARVFFAVGSFADVFFAVGFFVPGVFVAGIIVAASCIDALLADVFFADAFFADALCGGEADLLGGGAGRGVREPGIRSPGIGLWNSRGCREYNACGGFGKMTKSRNQPLISLTSLLRQAGLPTHSDSKAREEIVAAARRGEIEVVLVGHRYYVRPSLDVIAFFRAGALVARTPRKQAKVGGGR